MNKRGISVIIASILLILIVVSLFSVIAYFIRKGPEETMQKGSEMLEKIINCDEIKFQVEDICYDQNYAYSEGNGIRIGIKIKNNNNFELKDFRIKLSSGDTMISAKDTLFIEPYNIGTIYFAFPGLTSNIDWVKLYPIVNGETCDSKEYRIEINDGSRPC